MRYKSLSNYNTESFRPILEMLNKVFSDDFNKEPVKLEFFQYELIGLAEEETLTEQVIIDEAKRIKSIIHDIYQNNEVIYKIEPRHFEEIVAELLQLRNFKVDLTKRTRDGGYDILAIQEVGGLPIKFLVECKRYAQKNAVGVEIIRQLMDVVNEEQANAGLIVTTSYFTKDAKERQLKNPYRLNLEDRLDVLGWIEKYCRKDTRLL